MFAPYPVLGKVNRYNITFVVDIYIDRQLSIKSLKLTDLR